MLATTWSTRTPLIVLDWIEGVNLARLLADEGRPGLPVSSVLRWIAQAAEALTVLHHHGLVHGDVKPANLLVDGNGRVVLVDLGSSSVPRRRAPGGTSGYRAPEIAGGASADRARRRVQSRRHCLRPADRARPDWRPAGVGWASRPRSPDASKTRCGPVCRSIRPAGRPHRACWSSGYGPGWDDQTPTGVVTVLLTDVVDSSTRWEQAPHMVPAPAGRNAAGRRPRVEQHGGRRIGATVEGDATISVFPDAATRSEQRSSCGTRAPLPTRASGPRRPATGELVELDE